MICISLISGCIVLC